MKNSLGLAISASLLSTLTVGAHAAKKAVHYHLVATYEVGGDGGWDYLSADSKGHRLFLSRGSHVMVVDTRSGKLVGDIPDTTGVHGIALAPDLNRGFTSNGRDNSVTMFDLSTLKVLGKIPVTGRGPDCIIYDPFSKRVFTFNGQSRNSTAIDATTGKEIQTFDLGGRPEYAATDRKGNIFVNIEDKSEVTRIDAGSLKLTGNWSIAPGEGPSGLAIDAKRDLLFSVTDGKMMVSDGKAGKTIATVPVGDGPDAAAFDPALRLAFSSNGETGTLTVVRQVSADRFEVVENVPTEQGARTMALDPSTHYVYLVTAKFGEKAAGQRRAPMVPGSFKVLVFAP